MDECVNNPCGSASSCKNTIGSYECQCDPGFSHNGQLCQGMKCLQADSAKHHNTRSFKIVNFERRIRQCLDQLFMVVKYINFNIQ